MSLTLQDKKVHGRIAAAKWRATHREQHRQYTRMWRAKNKERAIAACRLWRELHPDRQRASTVAWEKRNPEKRSSAMTAWRKANKIMVRGYRFKYRANKYRNSTPSQIKEANKKLRLMLMIEETACAYCGIVFKTKTMHVDHILAISRGGAHSPENITMSCQKCNNQKREKILFSEWTPPIYASNSANS